MENEEKTCLDVTFSGHVQGVFFRRAIKRAADSLSLSGYVKNLPDGRVQMVAFGKKDLLIKLLEEIEKNPGMASFEKIEKSFQKKTCELKNFSIQY
jgi:acylphosphatase